MALLFGIRLPSTGHISKLEDVEVLKSPNALLRPVKLKTQFALYQPARPTVAVSRGLSVEMQKKLN